MSEASNSRLSVQDIINKYENQEDRFTFQTKEKQQLSPRGTFGNQAKQQQLLKEIDQTNLSKMLSDFSIVTEQEESIHQQTQFNNPIGMQKQSQQQQQMDEQYRGTFGANPFFQPKAEVTEIIEKSYMDDDLYDDMSVLKDKVLGLLQAYSEDLKKSQDVNMKQKIKQDVQKVAIEYSQIIDKINQSDISQLNVSQNVKKKENELNNMFNLVQEFLHKFDGQQRNSQILNFSQMLEQKLTKSRAVQNLDITVLPNIPLDETFYQNQSISSDKLATKVQKLKIMLMQELERQQMHYTKKILSEMIQNLNEILESNDIPTIKTVVFKIEDLIKQLPKLDQASIQLYDYMSKALKVSKRKLNQVDPIQREEKTIKRKFFDLATTMKNKLPIDHKGRQLMISVLYDQYVEAGSPQNLEEFISNQFK